MKGANINFAGGIAMLIGTIISLSAIDNKDYLWLIGSIPLIFGGFFIILNEFKGIKKEKKK